MERRNLIVIGAAVFIGLIAVYLANAWFTGVTKREEVVSKATDTTRIAYTR